MYVRTCDYTYVTSVIFDIYLDVYMYVYLLQHRHDL